MYRHAMMVCETIGCPHPASLPDPPWNISWEKLLDWLAYFSWKEHGFEEPVTDEDKMDYLRELEELERQQQAEEEERGS